MGGDIWDGGKGCWRVTGPAGLTCVSVSSSNCSVKTPYSR